MKINTIRAKEIQVWIDDHPEEKSQYEIVSVNIRGIEKKLSVWRMPTKLLMYNIENGRFAAELMAKESELKRKLDPTKEVDEKILQQLLLTQDEDETEALKKSIKDHGQKEPGIITFDGAVINANRRMAILSKLFDETGNPDYEYLRVARLPQDADQKDLWRIEAGIQFGKTFILDYPPVNEMLKLRNGQERGLSLKEISRTLLGRYTEDDITEELEVLKQIELYLEFIKKPKQYNNVKIHVEKFRSLHKHVMTPLKNKKLVTPEELFNINMIAFKLIQSDEVTHMNIRKLREMAQLKEAKEEIIKGMSLSQDELIESFNNALDMVESKKIQEEPRRLIMKALSAISNIDETNPQLQSEETKILLDKLEKEIQRLMPLKKVE